MDPCSLPVLCAWPRPLPACPPADDGLSFVSLGSGHTAGGGPGLAAGAAAGGDNGPEEDRDGEMHTQPHDKLLSLMDKLIMEGEDEAAAAAAAAGLDGAAVAVDGAEVPPAAAPKAPAPVPDLL